jgi:hypothetical protein
MFGRLGLRRVDRSGEASVDQVVRLSRPDASRALAPARGLCRSEIRKSGTYPHLCARRRRRRADDGANALSGRGFVGYSTNGGCRKTFCRVGGGRLVIGDRCVAARDAIVADAVPGVRVGGGRCVWARLGCEACCGCCVPAVAWWSAGSECVCAAACGPGRILGRVLASGVGMVGATGVWCQASCVVWCL